MTVIRKCACPQGGVKNIKVCYLIKRCDGHGGNVRVCGEV